MIKNDPNLSFDENVEMMKSKNFTLWKELYESEYGIPLEYTTEDEKLAPDYFLKSGAEMSDK
jgi:hypothetical protein